MNLEQLRALPDLYPPLRLRSGRSIKTTEWTSELTSDGLAVTLKTIFPPSDLRRTELLVTESSGALHVIPRERTGMADAQRFAELLRGRLPDDEREAAPLRLVQSPIGRAFVVGLPQEAPPPDTLTAVPPPVPTPPAAPEETPSIEEGTS